MKSKLTITKSEVPTPFVHLSPEDKMKKLYQLIQLSMRLTPDVLKQPQGKGLVITKPDGSI